MPLVHMVGFGFGRALPSWGSAAFAGFAHAAAPAAVAALWQDALVALALVLCLRFVLRVSAAHRFAAWAAGFAVAALLPFLPFLEHSGAVMRCNAGGWSRSRALASVGQPVGIRHRRSLAGCFNISRGGAGFSFAAAAQTVARRHSG